MEFLLLYTFLEIGIRKEVAEMLGNFFSYVCMLFRGGDVVDTKHRGVAFGFGFEAQGVGA